MSLYNIESNEKHSEVSSWRTPTMIENQIPKQLDEVNSSPTADKNQSERHSQIQQTEEDQLNYNIDEVFEAFTFNLSKKEVSQKRIRMRDRMMKLTNKFRKMRFYLKEQKKIQSQ